MHLLAKKVAHKSVIDNTCSNVQVNDMDKLKHLCINTKFYIMFSRYLRLCRKGLSTTSKYVRHAMYPSCVEIFEQRNVLFQWKCFMDAMKLECQEMYEKLLQFPKSRKLRSQEAAVILLSIMQFISLYDTLRSILIAINIHKRRSLKVISIKMQKMCTCINNDEGLLISQNKQLILIFIDLDAIYGVG